MVFNVATVEEEIRLNNLSPSTDFKSPGQLIPFATGIATLVDGLLVVFRPTSRNNMQATAYAAMATPNGGEPYQLQNRHTKLLTHRLMYNTCSRYNILLAFSTFSVIRSEMCFHCWLVKK